MRELKCTAKDEGKVRFTLYRDRTYLDDWTKLETLYTISKAPHMDGSATNPTRVAEYIDDKENLIFSFFDYDLVITKSLFAVTVIEEDKIKIGCVKQGEGVGYKAPSNLLPMDLSSYENIVRSILDLNSHWVFDENTRVMLVIVANSEDLLEYMSNCTALTDFFIIGADTSHVEF